LKKEGGKTSTKNRRDSEVDARGTTAWLMSKGREGPKAMYQFKGRSSNVTKLGHEDTGEPGKGKKVSVNAMV